MNRTSLRAPSGALALFAALATTVLPAALVAQVQEQQLRGIVLDARTGLAVAGADLRVDNPGGAVGVSGSDGRFLLRGVPAGAWTLRVSAPGYGSQTWDVELELGGVAEVEIRLSPPDEPDVAALLLPPPVDDPGDDPLRGLGFVTDSSRVAELAVGETTLGSLIRRAVPALRARTPEGAAGAGLCLEFRGAGTRSLRTSRGSTTADAMGYPCDHPAVYLDGVQLADPEMLYRRSDVTMVRRIQAIPPAEASGVFGGSLSGVVLVETALAPRRAAMRQLPGAGRGGIRRMRGGGNFDWSQDPAGHSFGRTFLGAFVGNAAGLAAGLQVGERCVYIEDRTDEIEFSCGDAGVAGVGVAAVMLPALGSALGARWAGNTERSQGRLVPALVGAGMGVLPGYIFSLSTVGGGVEAMNTVGAALLVVGTPLLTTFADRLYRRLH